MTNLSAEWEACPQNNNEQNPAMPQGNGCCNTARQFAAVQDGTTFAWSQYPYCGWLWRCHRWGQLCFASVQSLAYYMILATHLSLCTQQQFSCMFVCWKTINIRGKCWMQKKKCPGVLVIQIQAMVFYNTNSAQNELLSLNCCNLLID